MAAARWLTLALALLSACAGAPTASGNIVAEPQPPWFVGMFAGADVWEHEGERIEEGTGYVELRADGTFSLHFGWVPTVYTPQFEVDAAGPWVLTPPPEDSYPRAAHLALRQASTS